MHNVTAAPRAWGTVPNAGPTPRPARAACAPHTARRPDREGRTPRCDGSACDRGMSPSLPPASASGHDRRRRACTRRRVTARPSLVPIRVPTPKPSMGASSAISAAMAYSSRSPDARMRTSGNPPSSRIDRTSRARPTRSRNRDGHRRAICLRAGVRSRSQRRDARRARSPMCRAAGRRCRERCGRTSGTPRARRRRSSRTRAPSFR